MDSSDPRPTDAEVTKTEGCHANDVPNTPADPFAAQRYDRTATSSNGTTVAPASSRMPVQAANDMAKNGGANDSPSLIHAPSASRSAGMSGTLSDSPGPIPIRTTSASAIESAQGGQFHATGPIMGQASDVATVDHAEISSLTASLPPGGPVDLRDTPEWDASKVPPHKFQKPKGSTFATPNSRDSHHDGHKDRDASYHEAQKSFKSAGLFSGRRKSSKNDTSEDSQKSTATGDSPKKSLVKRVSSVFMAKGSEDGESETRDDEGSPKPSLVKRLSIAMKGEGSEDNAKQAGVVNSLHESSAGGSTSKGDNADSSPKPSLLKRASIAMKGESVEKKDGEGSPKSGLLGHLRRGSKSDDLEKNDGEGSPKSSRFGNLKKGSKSDDVGVEEN